jgi:hypothetical protein
MTDEAAREHAKVDETAGWAHDALNKLKRASKRNTGCHLSANEVFALSLTRIGELWDDEDPRDTKGPKP